MSESPDRIRRHIENLTEFEAKFGKYVAALEADWFAAEAVGAVGAPDDLGSDWSSQEYAKRKREIAELATKADLAMKASGVGQINLHHPPALGGGLRAGDLPSQVFDFVEFSDYNDDGLTFQRKILERVPSQIAGLRVRLEEAEETEEEANLRAFGEMYEESRDRNRQAQERREQEQQEKRAAKEAPPSPAVRTSESHRPWWENPWLVGIGVTVIGGLALLAIVAAFGS